MNKYAVGVGLMVFATMMIALLASLKYSQATVLFGLIAAISAPVVIHKVLDTSVVWGFVVGLSTFASFPFKKLFQIDGFVPEVAVSLAYCAILWVIGFGWKRSWR